MTTITVISPKVSQESAKYLSDVLNENGVDSNYVNISDNTQRKFIDVDALFNYGFSKNTKSKLTFNRPENINSARDKIECFNLLKGNCPTVLYTKKYEEAVKWIKEGRIAVARHRVMGDNGKGLVYCSTVKELEKNKDAKFFTRFVEHEREYRVNVWKGKILSVYDKRDLDGYFKFTLLKKAEVLPVLEDIAQKAFESIELDWMGIDVLRTAKGNVFVLEVNSAPVLFPYTTTKLVANIIKEFQ